MGRRTGVKHTPETLKKLSAAQKRRWGSTEDRFWAKTNRTSDIGCWLWTGAVNNWGYAKFYEDATHIHAHAWAYKKWIGPVPKGKILRHSCDTPNCVNPTHLMPGTSAENSADMVARGRSKGNSNGRLPPETRNKMVALIIQGKRNTEIVKLTGVCPTTIRRWKRKIEQVSRQETSDGK